MTKRKIIYVDSGSQLTATNNVFTTSLDVEISSDYNYVSLIGFQCPVSYYNISSGNNTIQLRENTIVINVSIPVGNYNIFSFASAISALLSSVSPNGLTYTITYPSSYTNADTGKFNYTVNSNTIPVSFIFPINNAVGENFGFPAGYTANFIVSGANQILTSLNVVSFIAETSIHLHMANLIGDQSAYSDVLQVIYSSNSLPYSVISWTNPQIIETSKRLIGTVGRTLEFSICDEYGIPIYLNGQNCLLTLLFFQMKEPIAESNTLLAKYIYMRTNLLENEQEEKKRENEYKEQIIRLLEANNMVLNSLLEKQTDLFTNNKDAFTSNTIIPTEEAQTVEEDRAPAWEDLAKARENDKPPFNIFE